MSLTPGARLGSFEVMALIGEGGMGQVYRARDTKLGRDVAIKVLPDTFARDAERLARFRREAQALAALNDPHIAQIYHLEESGDGAALVMEFVEGQTVAEALASRSFDMDDALRLAAEIAMGLETAHERGIVHRDLKPANIKITPDGHVKILDFGLAKAMATGDDSGHQLANSPTLTARATEAGIILGTAAYMSPEQARGKTVDKRTDIWAFGSVLFEMLTGRRAFDGETVSDTLASVLRSDPDWSALPATVPAHARALLARCLERDPSRRLRDIGEARLALAGSAGPMATSTLQMPAATTGMSAAAPMPSARPWPWIAGTALLAVALAALVPTSSLLRSDRDTAGTAAESVELNLAAPEGAEFQVGSNTGTVALSPDGTRIAFVAATEKATTLWIRSLSTDDARSISGTENASNQFWSPDGRHLGFFANGKLRTVDLAGGIPEDLADAPNGRGGAWSEDDTIIFSPMGGAPLSRVSAAGGAVTPLTTLDIARGDNAHYWPVFLPGGRKFLYFARSTQPGNSGIYLGSMDGGSAVRLVATLSSGLLARHPISKAWYLLWTRDEDLLAQPFDVGTGALSGSVSTIATGLLVNESQRLVYASASTTGTLAWSTARTGQTVLARYARDGRRLGALDIPAGLLVQPALSPDGTRLLFTRVERGGADIFLLHLKSGVIERLTTDPDYEELPVWTPDGKAVSYTGSVKGVRWEFRLALGTGAAPVARLSGVEQTVLESPDGRHLIYSVINPKTGYDVVVKSAAGSDPPAPLAQESGNEQASAQSADGQSLLIAVQARSGFRLVLARIRGDAGRPTLGARVTVAEDAATSALRPDGREVVYVTQERVVKSVPIATAGEALTAGATSALFRLPHTLSAITIDPAGGEFIVAEAPYAATQTLRILTRWDLRLGK